MRQWDPFIFDASYSSKLHMGPIQKLAGYSDTSKFYFNMRKAVEPPKELLQKTPIGQWVYKALDDLKKKDTHWKSVTAHHMLSFFVKLNMILLQDAVALLVVHPNRASHPIFLVLPVFRSAEFETY